MWFSVLSFCLFTFRDVCFVFTQRNIVLHVHISGLFRFSGMFNIIFKRRMRQMFTKSKSIVLYRLDNVVIKYTLKEQQIKASAERMYELDEKCWWTLIWAQFETVKISSEALEEVNVYLWAADWWNSLHLISLVTRENKWGIKEMCDFLFTCWINVEYDYHIEDWMCVIGAGCKGNYSNKICSRRVIWLHLHYRLWFLSSGRLYTPKLSLFLLFCMSGFVKGVFHSKMSILLSFPHPHFIQKLYYLLLRNTKATMQTALIAIFH